MNCRNSWGRGCWDMRRWLRLFRRAPWWCRARSAVEGHRDGERDRAACPGLGDPQGDDNKVQVDRVLTSLDVSDLWEHADENERSTPLDELLQDVTVHPDRLPETPHGAPTPNVGFSEVGLNDSELSGVGGPS